LSISVRWRREGEEGRGKENSDLLGRGEGGKTRARVLKPSSLGARREGESALYSLDAQHERVKRGRKENGIRRESQSRLFFPDHPYSIDPEEKGEERKK